MKYSDIKKIKEFCESLHSNPCWREVLKNIEAGENDFCVDDVRFINDNDIMDILENELAADEYLLGAFTATAIAEATDWPIALIEAAQKGEAFEEIGKAMTGEHVANLASIYVQWDGYGHHFNHWDGSEEEFQINDDFFHVFDNH